jgi:hypothetical protein
MQTETASLTEFYGDMISLYSRADAIRDGVLVPLSPELCKDAGVVLPVCVTDTVWNGYIDPANMTEMPGQSVEGRMWDLLWMFRCAVKVGKGGGDRIRFSVLFQTKPKGNPEQIDLIAVCGPGDEADPVITIMLPGED